MAAYANVVEAQPTLNTTILFHIHAAVAAKHQTFRFYANNAIGANQIAAIARSITKRWESIAVPANQPNKLQLQQNNALEQPKKELDAKTKQRIPAAGVIYMIDQNKQINYKLT